MQNQYNHITTKFVLISKSFFKVYRYLIIADCFLIFWFCVKGNQIYYTWITYTPASLVSIQILFSHCVKYAEIRAFSGLYFLVCGQSRIRIFPSNFCRNTGKYRDDSVHILKNTDQRKLVFRRSSRSVLLNIFSHKLDLQRNIGFASARIYELFNCAKIKSTKINRVKIRGARNLMGLRYYKPTRVDIFWNNNYIEYKSLSVKEHLNKLKPYLRDMIIDLQKSATWKAQLTTAINFISSKDVKVLTNQENLKNL